MECGAGVIGTSCTIFEYGDVLDRMGGSDNGHFNSFQKQRLGWLDYGASPAITSVTASGTYLVEPYAGQSFGVKALRIPGGTDPGTGRARSYYVEFRQATGFDGFLSTSNYSSVLNGITLRLGTPGDPDSSHLLDATPESLYYDWRDLALPVGATYSDSAAGISIRLDSLSASGALVSVTVGTSVTPSPSPAPVSGAPVATNDSASTAQNTPVTIAVLANDSDPNGDALSVVSATKSAHGTATVGADGRITYAPARTFKGTDQFQYTISDGKLTATATVTVTVLGQKGGRK
ncbi:MAG: Ig-like domain-containing protein [Oligoflexia bacterium]|nr:Ig-like domain-containing protein [Oligoflexia bacterium]